MIQVRKGSVLGFPSITVATACYEVTVVPGIGGRIMGFGADGINLLYQNEALAGFRPVYDADSAEEMRRQRIEGPLLLYGGEKTWLAPQSDWGSNAYADLDHGDYECSLLKKDDRTVELVLTSPICRETGLQLVRTITCIDGEPYMDMEQKLINHSAVPVTKGLWQVTMLNRPGTALIPDGPLLRGEEPIPIYYGENASFQQVEGGWQMELQLQEELEYKLGFATDAGCASARHEAGNGQMYTLTKRFEAKADVAAYPHGTVVEVYNASKYAYYELEVHSPACTLRPGESASFAIRWELDVVAAALFPASQHV
ncbi:uncharacterized protein DUF4380 [Paenibacillus taihuensis]|uniref:Uncharacterized protein DUF4380 n=1 Tax=Paenibacillus taihuensis TaxID=1156355 RepID=A0A3D9SFA4_9BACL|nr:DUF4380 domain-containing protein [Paenibacillus taihuensis]REE87437.1 uncharacterized protein DUF4380 [Paenibacillus taihuensis]